MDTHADLSVQLVHMSEGTFSHTEDHFVMRLPVLLHVYVIQTDQISFV